MNLPLGKLPGEEEPPLTDSALAAIEDKLRGNWASPVTVERRDLEALVTQIRWMQRRMASVEATVEPIARGIRKVLARLP